MSENDEPRLVTWWTPTGWVRQPPPNPWRSWSDDGLLSPTLADLGYDEAVSIGEDAAVTFELKIYRSEAVAYVDLWDCTGQVADFFINDADYTPFVFDKLPRLIADLTAVDIGAELARIRMALIPFVRHGHGRHTLSEDGLSSMEEMERDRVRLAEFLAKRKAVQP